MKFCSQCGHKVTMQVPENDNRLRAVCSHCDTVHYKNPHLITGTVPVAPDGRILLCRRAIEPQLGLWTLPAGFMENGESTIEGALRETLEESMVQGENPRLLSLISLPQWNQVHVFYRISMVNFSFAPTEESTEVKLFTQEEIPWDELAFETVEFTIKHHYETLGKNDTVLNTEIYFNTNQNS